MLLIFLILCVIYWLLYSSFGEKRVDRPDSQKLTFEKRRDDKPFQYDMLRNQNKMTLSNSENQSWSFEWTDNERFYFDDASKTIIEKDDCFGKPDGSKVIARRKPLYDYLQRNDIEPMSGGSYYFHCDHNRIRNLYECPPGTLFDDGDCQLINICTGQEDGKTFPDSTDFHYYRECRDGKPIRKRCKPESFFYVVDACRSEAETLFDICGSQNNNTLFPINRKKYIRCFDTQSIVETCPEGTMILKSWDRCYPDSCYNCSDQKEMPIVTDGPFQYSPGYFVCKDHRIQETVRCPQKWDPMTSDGGANLTHLPMVFNSRSGKCENPSFSENVRPIDPDKVVVPAHEFTKYICHWKHSEIFDSVVGYRCNGQAAAERFVVEPGQRIDKFEIKDACSVDTLQKIPIGDKTDRYFDCQTQSIIQCEKSQIFSIDGDGCVDAIENAHAFKNMPLFRLGGLSRYNNWIEPWHKLGKSKRINECTEPESQFIPNYNVCSHPSCAKYPFLKQARFMNILLPDGKRYCSYDGEKIRRRKYITPDKVHYWLQRLVPTTAEITECIPGQRIQSGNFLMDSTLFATCDQKQPFVFCPSSSTKGIRQVKEIDRQIYACEPNDGIFSAIIPLDTSVTLERREISMILPQFDARYRIDDDEEKIFQGYRPIDVYPNEKKITFWSDQPSEIFFNVLVNYPINTFIQNPVLKYSGEMNVAYLLGKNKYTYQPVNLPIHDVEERLF